MGKMKYLLVLLIMISSNVSGQLFTPLEKSEYARLSTNKDILGFINESLYYTKLVEFDTLAISKNGKIVPLLKISNSHLGSSKEKIKVLIFAQQHGNEQSGKEGALYLLKQIAIGNLNYLFDKIDLLIVPQMNPDGGDLDNRRNGNEIDLNRNHLILTEPEVIGLHNLFYKYLPEATLDVHEYTSLNENWIKYGYRKNYDEQIGSLTNPNIYKPLVDLQRKEFLPFIENYLNKYGFTHNEYIVGGPPNKNRIRYSTVDINDGRQSFGILNTFSFIVEGKKGSTSIENIKHRTEGQYIAMLGFLDFIYNNSEKIKKNVIDGRKDLKENRQKKIALQMDHVSEGMKDLTLHSISTDKDTTITIANYDTKVKVELSISKPLGYLIKKKDKILINLIKKHKIDFHNYDNSSNHKIYQYCFSERDSVVLEELKVFLPLVKKIELKKINYSNYYFIPLNQIQSSLLMLMLEPQSMMNLAQYKDFSAFLNSDINYPILRVE